MFWDAPDRETVSLGVETLADPSGLEVAGHIWVDAHEARNARFGGAPTYSEGLPAATIVPWRA